MEDLAAARAEVVALLRGAIALVQIGDEEAALACLAMATSRLQQG